MSTWAAANTHVWAHVFSFLADPLDSADCRRLLATCKKAALAFDTAVHAGWIPMAAHLSTAPLQDGATCLWVDGWRPLTTAQVTRLHLRRAPPTAARYLSSDNPCFVSPTIATSSSSSINAKASSNSSRRATFSMMQQQRARTRITVRLEQYLLQESTLRELDLWAVDRVLVCETIPLPFLQRRSTTTISAARRMSSIDDPRMVIDDHLSRSRMSADRDDNGGGHDAGGCDEDRHLVMITGSSLPEEPCADDELDAPALFRCRASRVSLYPSSRRTSIPDCPPSKIGFLNCTRATLTRFDTSGLASITAIGSHFLDKCSGIRSIDLAGFRNVVSISSHFMAECTGLRHLDTTPLEDRLESLGSDFLASCTTLVWVDLGGLRNLTAVESGFLSECRKLEDLETLPLRRVVTVASGFCRRCSSLRRIDTFGLVAVEYFGHNCFSGCTSLLEFDTERALVSLVCVEGGFLERCSSLATVETSAMSHLAAIGESFCRQCTALREFDTTPLRGLQVIHESFLQGCSSLRWVNAGGLHRVEEIPSGFLSDCSSLRHFDFSPFASSLRRVCDDVLAGCTSLGTVDMSGLCQVSSIGARFLSRTRVDYLDTSPLRCVEELGDEFLQGVPTLTSFDGLGLTQLREIKRSFLADATGLEGINLSNCRCLRRIGERFGRNAENVKRVELPPGGANQQPQLQQHPRISFEGMPFERTGDPRHPYCAILMRDLTLRALLRSLGLKVPSSRLD